MACNTVRRHVLCNVVENHPRSGHIAGIVTLRSSIHAVGASGGTSDETNFLAFAAVIAAAGLSGCGYNDMARGDQSIKAAWSEVLNQYQRRSDLIPNLVNTVKGYAAQEQDTLTKVVEARAKAMGIQATPELVNDPVAFKNFIAAQGQLQGALSRLLRWPKLPEPQERRPVPRPDGAAGRHRESASRWRATATSRRSRLQQLGGVVPEQPDRDGVRLQGKPQFTVENEAEIKTAPKVDFNKPAPAAPARPSP